MINNKKLVSKFEESVEQAQSIRIANIYGSIAIVKELITACETAQDDFLVAKAKSKLAFYYMINGDFKLAKSIAKEALLYFNTNNNEIEEADVKYTLASVYYKCDKLHLGLHFCLECIDVYTKHKDYANQAKCYKVMGTIYEFFEDLDNAINAYNNCILNADLIGDRNMKSNAFNPLSGLFLNEGKVDEAMELIERSIAIKQETGDIRGLAFAYYGRGKVYARLKQFSKSEHDYKESLKIHNSVGERLGKCLSLNKLGELYIIQNEVSKAIVNIEEAYEIAKGNSFKMPEIKSLELLYKVHKLDNNIEKALYYLEKFHTEKIKIAQSNEKELVKSYGLIYEKQTESLQAKLHLEKSEIIAEKNKAEYSAKIRQDFLSLMSHEIRTPLNAIITISNLLKNSDNEDEQQLINSLRYASNNLLMLVNDILDINKLEGSTVALELVPVKLKKFFEHTIKTYQSMAEEKGIALNLSYDLQIHENYKADSPRLLQIIGNLISNAIKFTEKGKIDLIVNRVASDEKFDKIYIGVKDTGAGIPESFLNTIFDKFTQSKATNSKKHSGTGLGLAIVKNIASLYKTEIKIDTVLGEGSNFYFVIELEKVNNVLNSIKQDKSSFAHLKVLLVDDNNINLLVGKKLLSNWEVIVETANNAYDAIQKADTKKYDVILMDIHMPEMNGDEAAEVIKNSHSINRDTKIFALTADVTITQENNNVKGVFDAILRKPIIYSELHNALNSVSKELS
jgi:signal transduction histidine kinase/ActR/RegA family two-component response regulator